MADELHEVELFGFVTTTTSAQVRAFALRLLAMVGDNAKAASQQPSRWVAGTVRHFYSERGHGFVHPDGGGARDSVMFKRSVAEGATDADLVHGRKVRILVEDTGRGPRASRPVLAG